MAYTYAFPHMAVTVDLVLFDAAAEAPRILLIQRRNNPFKDMWALPGGYVDMDERIEAAARRELAEETGAVARDVRFIGYFDAIDRDPRERTVSFAFWAEVDAAGQSIRAADDAAAAAWHDCGDLPALAFDHARIVTRALDAYRAAR